MIDFDQIVESPLDDLEDFPKAKRGPAPKTHCKRGHEFTPENSRFAGGRKYCLKCHLMRSKNWKDGRSQERKEVDKEKMRAYAKKKRHAIKEEASKEAA